MAVLDEGSAGIAVQPIENSTAGIESENYDLLAEYEHFIVGERMMQIRHCLLGVPGAKEEDIKRVYAHPQALMQCERYLRDAGVQQISMANNAFAAEKVAKDKDPSQAAIAGAHAADIYGLRILREGINSAHGNTTRFIAVSNQKIFLKDAGMISLCFELPHESGSLFHILSHFIYNDLNLTRIDMYVSKARNIYPQLGRLPVKVMLGDTIVRQFTGTWQEAADVIREYGKTYFLDIRYPNSKDALLVKLKGFAPNAKGGS